MWKEGAVFEVGRFGTEGSGFGLIFEVLPVFLSEVWAVFVLVEN
jgi:hypothetical protein